MTRGTRAALVAGFAALVAAAPLVAQQHQHQHQHRHQQAREGQGPGPQMNMDTGWKELNGFHSLMHLSHQPLMQSDDVGPARRVAADLAAAARLLAGAPVPETCVGEDLAGQTRKLAEAAEAYAKLVADGADDDAVKAGVNGVHDLMEPIMMACRKRS